ncbi:DUF2723 domain-containing protein [candidate division KSB1 bacterium]|nr:DUF2723 domain-containing protein [candidate division KSB1 bacterium]
MKNLKTIFGSTLFLATLATYVSTLAPTTSFWDAGEFISCAYNLGIPHPPGAPLYLLLARLFAILPWAGDIAMRVNLLSALMSACATTFTFLIIIRMIELCHGSAATSAQRLLHYIAGAIGALAFAFSDTQWFNSVEAELYSASLLSAALILWVMLKWQEQAGSPTAGRWLLLAAYLTGLTIGIHLLGILILPSVLLLIYLQRAKISWGSFFVFALFSAALIVLLYPVIAKELARLIANYSLVAAGILLAALLAAIHFSARARRREISLTLIGILLVLTGYSTYTTIFIRSQHNPVIDMNNPDTAERFNAYVQREQYGNWSLWPRRAEFWSYQIERMYLRYFGWQFIGKDESDLSDEAQPQTFSSRGLWGVPFLVGLLGMVHHFRKDWRRAITLLTMFLVMGLALVIYLNQEDPQPRERDYVYTGSFLAFALWIGIGAAAILESLRARLQSNLALRRPAMMAAATALFALVPLKMFAFNYHTHDRSGNFLAYDYSYNLLQSCAPDAIIFTNGDNDTYPLWALQTVYGIRPDVNLVCLSLLNTDWYIQQLKHGAPKAPIRLSDERIAALQPWHWPKRKTVTLEVPPQIYAQWQQALAREASLESRPTVEFEVAPTWAGQFLRIQDMMILHILAENKFQRPVYFAVTVSPENMLGLQDYLRMEGLAFRVLPLRQPNGHLDPQLMHAKLFEEFRYRNLDNPDVHFDNDSLALLTNYRSAFLQLAHHYHLQNENEKTVAVLDKMAAILPEHIVPLPSANLSLAIGQLYHAAGKKDELPRRLAELGRSPKLAPRDKINVAELYATWLQDWANAESLAQTVLREAPKLPDAYSFLLNLYTQRGEKQKAVAVLQQWLEKNPSDQLAAQELQKLQE